MSWIRILTNRELAFSFFFDFLPVSFLWYAECKGLGLVKNTLSYAQKAHQVHVKCLTKVGDDPTEKEWFHQGLRKSQRILVCTVGGYNLRYM